VSSSHLPGKSSVLASECSCSSGGARMSGFEGFQVFNVDGLASGLKRTDASHELGVNCAFSSESFSSFGVKSTVSTEVLSMSGSHGSSSGVASSQESGRSDSSSGNSLDTGSVCGTSSVVCSD